MEISTGMLIVPGMVIVSRSFLWMELEIMFIFLKIKYLVNLY
jgi:hypothetical protein